MQERDQNRVCQASRLLGDCAPSLLFAPKTAEKKVGIRRLWVNHPQVPGVWGWSRRDLGRIAQGAAARTSKPKTRGGASRRDTLRGRPGALPRAIFWGQAEPWPAAGRIRDGGPTLRGRGSPGAGSALGWPTPPSSSLREASPANVQARSRSGWPRGSSAPGLNVCALRWRPALSSGAARSQQSRAVKPVLPQKRSAWRNTCPEGLVPGAAAWAWALDSPLRTSSPANRKGIPAVRLNAAGSGGSGARPVASQRHPCPDPRTCDCFLTCQRGPAAVIKLGLLRWG